MKNPYNSNKTKPVRLTKRGKFNASFNTQAISTKWGIKNLFREREIEAAQASIEYKKTALINSYPGMSEAERIQSVADFKKTLVQGVQSGVMYADEAKEGASA